MGARLQAIRPRKSPAYKLPDFEKAMNRALDKTGTAMIRDFRRTVDTWETKPTFRVMAKMFKVGSRVVSITVGTDNEIYGYVSRGTKPHIIRAKNGGVLAFSGKFAAKTKPGRFLSKTGGSSGETVFTPEVHHPGTAPRRFEELVVERHQKLDTLEKNIQAEWDKLIAKGGK